MVPGKSADLTKSRGIPATNMKSRSGSRANAVRPQL
jgi:hypothetical protein